MPIYVDNRVSVPKIKIPVVKDNNQEVEPSADVDSGSSNSSNSKAKVGKGDKFIL